MWWTAIQFPLAEDHKENIYFNIIPHIATKSRKNENNTKRVTTRKVKYESKRKLENYKFQSSRFNPLKVVSATFLLVWFLSLKESFCETRKKLEKIKV